MGKPVSVLIVSGLLDNSTDRVCHYLKENGASFLRLNREQLSQLQLSFDPISVKLTCKYEGNSWNIDKHLRSVWWRQPTFLRNNFAGSLSNSEQLQRTQWPALLRGLMLFDDANWINRPDKTYLAECKPVQLQRAHKLGFNVPSTIITNDPTEEIASKIGRKIAVKSVDTVLLRQSDSQQFSYTTIMDWTVCREEDFMQVPVTCQFVLSPKLDLRVTIVGDRLWCHAILNNGQGIEGDWRLHAKQNLQYEEFELPEEVEQNCRNLMKSFELKFGAIDLAVSDGKIWFIEINPTGEWGWLDGNDYEMSQCIAKELMC